LLGGCKEHAGDIIAIEKGDRLIGGHRGKTCACWKKRDGDQEVAMVG